MSPFPSTSIAAATCSHQSQRQQMDESAPRAGVKNRSTGVHAWHRTDLPFSTTSTHGSMQRSTIILHLHHEFKDGLIQGLINNVTWIDDMAQGVALIPPLNYKCPLTSSHSTHPNGTPLYNFPRCKSSLA